VQLLFLGKSNRVIRLSSSLETHYWIQISKIQILGVKSYTQKISDHMREVQDKVAKDVFTILIMQARDQALKMNTGQAEALGESYLGRIGIIEKEFDMDFMVSAPDDFIEEAKQEILRLNEEVNFLMVKKARDQSTNKNLNKQINQLEDKLDDLEDETTKFKLEIEELTKKLEECRYY
jgi:DNA repair exonuclease SbcCD ATPase subunit